MLIVGENDEMDMDGNDGILVFLRLLLFLLELTFCPIRYSCKLKTVIIGSRRIEVSDCDSNHKYAIVLRDFNQKQILLQCENVRLVNWTIFLQ